MSWKLGTLVSRSRCGAWRPQDDTAQIPWEGQGRGSSVDRFLRVPDIKQLCFILQFSCL